MRRPVVALLSFTAWVVQPACGDETNVGDHASCTSSKCDLPEGPDGEMCELRRADAFDPNQLAFVDGFLRWSCSDVDGVTAEDRGQEYCEYFAIVNLPPATAAQTAPAPIVLGRNLGPDYTHGTTPTALEIDADQLAALEAGGDAIVGQCVFTSWNADIGTACAGECPVVAGLPVEPDNFRMHFDVNTYEAAVNLVADCAAGTPGELADDFSRGCMMNAAINDTAFRKSDTTVCAAVMRVAECGCALASELPLAEWIAGPDRRGFPLGTWRSPRELPAGCRFVDLGDASQTIVTCDLSAADVIEAAFDLKGHCQSTYGDNVVVHVPMPSVDELRCGAQQAALPAADECPARPWLLEG